MSTIYMYTNNRRAVQEWQKTLKQSYEVRVIKNLDEINKAGVVLFYDQGSAEEIAKQLKPLQTKGLSKQVLLLRDVPKVEEGEHFLAYAIGGYGNAHMSEDALDQAIKIIADGNSWFYPQLMQHIISKVNRMNDSISDEGLFDGLTQREKEVALLVAKGESNKLIADHLDISENTVKIHVASIFEKMGVKSRVALALRASHKA